MVEYIKVKEKFLNQNFLIQSAKESWSQVDLGTSVFSSQRRWVGEQHGTRRLAKPRETTD